MHSIFAIETYCLQYARKLRFFRISIIRDAPISTPILRCCHQGAAFGDRVQRGPILKVRYGSLV